MMDRKPSQTETTTDRRPATTASENSRYETFRAEACSDYSSWNSWGERNPLTLGSFGRW